MLEFICNFFKLDQQSIIHSLSPLVHFSILFGTTCLRIEDNGQTCCYRFFDLPRLLNSVWTVYYIYNCFSICVATDQPTTYYLRSLCFSGTTIETFHIILPFFNGFSLVREINEIVKFDSHIESLVPKVKPFHHSRSGLLGALLQCSIVCVVYSAILYDYIRMRRRVIFMISLFFINMHNLDVSTWFLVMSHELYRRFQWLKVEIVETVSRLESGLCERERDGKSRDNVEEKNERFIESNLSEDEILLENLRLCYSRLLSISNDVVSTFGFGMFITIYQIFITTVFNDFYTYMYLVRELNAGFILAVGHKLLIVWISVYFSEKLMDESNAILGHLELVRISRLSKFARLQVEILQAQVNAKPLVVHICNMFVLNRFFYAAMLSTMLTWIIVMMQMISTITTGGADKGALPRHL
ncbi:uncharacterized protein LOC120351651 [Nilaparvata lugens]|uniref:uncharacterized protein LOC120351651 n=1 Tax=Nilaparvata lugens TaxID=108931 RepID=UPI00193D55B3|nr:uncharacterized protein LOC120351651 [Nilaparvata lugens]